MQRKLLSLFPFMLLIIVVCALGAWAVPSFDDDELGLLPVDGTKCQCDCGGDAIIQGGPGAATPGARVHITDGGATMVSVTAGTDGSFSIAVGSLDHRNCSNLLVTQTVSTLTSISVAVHCDPPNEEFATPDWEGVFARYLQRSRAREFWADGISVYVRPFADRMQTSRGATTKVVGLAGAVNEGALVSVATSDGRVVFTRAAADGSFAADVGRRPKGDTVLSNQQFLGRRSRAAVVRTGV